MASRVDIQLEIEKLLQFGLSHRLIADLDVIPVRNQLLHLFRSEEPYTGTTVSVADMGTSPAAILERMLDYAVQQGMIADTVTERDLMDAQIMGFLMPRQSEVARNFWETASTDSIEKATDDFYHLSQASNYIRMDRIQKNEYWQVTTDYGNLEITINLSKPEKDPQEIAAERNAPSSNYPLCVLCPENVGYAGRINHPARQNHRIIPVQLDEEPWYLQYSPYVYYNEHCIILSEVHRPMTIQPDTFEKLFDFVESFPHYFVGSNADLPIVGGSILNHDHFQGGRHRFPMEMATVEQAFIHPDATDVQVGIVKWPMSVIRLQSADRRQLTSVATTLLASWRNYSDPMVEIAASSTVEGKKVPHNTITPIARLNEAGQFELDLVLRNNRTSDEHPDGIFHPHQPLHHIKKENIGLIEVMGLAVLPGRLKAELKQIEKLLTGAEPYEPHRFPAEHSLHKHLTWIERMLDKYGVDVEESVAQDILKDEVGQIFLQVLMDAGVFKRDSNGQAAFSRFMQQAGFQLN